MKHQTISFIKSALRIIGLISIFINLPLAIISLLVAEVIGIFEEL